MSDILANILRSTLTKTDPLTISSWFEHQKLEGMDVVCIYGVDPEIYRQVAQWVRKRCCVVFFLEDEVSNIYSLFQTSSFDKGHPQIHIEYFEHPQDVAYLSERFFSRRWTLITAPNKRGQEKLERQECQRSEALLKALQLRALQSKTYHEEKLIGRAPFYQNAYSNLKFMKSLEESFLASKLIGKFKGIPAIICGGGPSLDEKMSLISQLQDRALIFAGGAGVTALTRRGIIPHFGGAIDPNPSQAVRIREQLAFDLPYFYGLRLHRDALKAIHKRRIYVPGLMGCPFTSYVEQAMGISAPSIDAGVSVTTFLVSIAKALGCDLIVLAGVDLKTVEGRVYASGVECFDAFDRSNRWIIEKGWIDNFEKKHPDLLQWDLAKVSLNRLYDLKGMVKGALEEAHWNYANVPKLESIEKELMEESSLRKAITQDFIYSFDVATWFDEQFAKKEKRIAIQKEKKLFAEKYLKRHLQWIADAKDG